MYAYPEVSFARLKPDTFNQFHITNLIVTEERKRSIFMVVVGMAIDYNSYYGYLDRRFVFVPVGRLLVCISNP